MTVPKLLVIPSEDEADDLALRLEEVLETVRQGKVSSLAIAIVYRDGTSGRGWSKAPSISALIGSIARLQAAIIKSAEE